MSFAEFIYQNSPIFIQNLMISVYGLKLYRERFARNHKKILKKLLDSQWLSSNELQQIQLTKLQKLIKHAVKSCPYYSSLFAAQGLSANDIKSIKDLKKIPLLSKETIREKGDLLCSSAYRADELISLNTSGTTGKTLKIFVNYEGRRQQYAFIRRFHIWAGLKTGKHGAIFGGRPIVPNNQKKKIFWRYNALLDSYLFSSYHLSDENLPSYIEKLST